jgi:hypothetical protein
MTHAENAAQSDDTRPFPIQRDRKLALNGESTNDLGLFGEASAIPWWLAEIAYDHYRRRFPTSAQAQSLKRLAQRGGFGRYELIRLLRRGD